MYKYLFVTGLLWALTTADVCPYKECSCQGSYIECQSQGLNSIPALLNTNNTNFTVLQLEGNRLTRVPAGSLPPNLKEISFQLNPIATIDDAAFDGSATTLQTLRFFAANFTRIPNAFLRLQNLRALYIYNVNISDWNPDAMKNIGRTVETLFLGNVGLSEWPTWLHDYPRLFNLYISDSSFSHLPDDALDLSANTLTHISLIQGGLTAVPKTLSKHKALKYVYFQQNKISDVSSLPHLSNLTNLNLNYNNISNATELSIVLRPFADTLQDIDIVGNALTAIPDVSFLKQVGSLEFRSNNISDPHSGSVPPNLYTIGFAFNILPSIPRILSQLKLVTVAFLHSNSITQITGADFPPLTKSVTLQNNLISELTDLSFPPNSSIRFLYLDNNPISQISLHAFDTLSGLYELYLRENKLTRMPLALASLHSLYKIDISNNTDLVCTCDEKGLQSWFDILSSRSPPSYIVGKCGETDVYTFFKKLSPACPATTDNIL